MKPKRPLECAICGAPTDMLARGAYVRGGRGPLDRIIDALTTMRAKWRPVCLNHTAPTLRAFALNEWQASGENGGTDENPG